jgi:hypothetical protein
MLLALFAVIVLFGVPSALWQMFRHRNWKAATAALAVWAATALPALIVTTPWVG